MNITLWVIQILLALWNLIGATYMLSNYKLLASPWALSMLPQPIWIILGVLQILFSLGLVFSGVFKKFPKLTSICALGLAVISLLGIGLYATYADIGVLWGIIPAILALFVGYKRWPTKIA